MSDDNNTSIPPKHYGAAAIRRSFMHFIFGKGCAAVSTLAVLFLIIRELNVSEFAAYTSLHALVLIIGLISSFGIPQVLHRFLPELRTHHNNQAMYLLLCGGILARAVFYGVLCVLLLPFLQTIAATFKLSDWLPLLPLYFVVGFLRVNATFIAQALESLLWQRDAQYSLAAGAIFKLAGVIYFIDAGTFDLQAFVWVECFSELLSMAMLLLFMLSRWVGDTERGHGDMAVLQEDGRRYLRFGYWCYLQNLTSVFYGSAPNRLFVAYFLSADYIAVFGVVDRLVDFARRYEPLRMFVGLIRPVLMSRFSQNKDFAQLSQLANLVLLVNFVILFGPLLLLMVGGGEFLSWMTDGKYADIKWLVTIFYVVLLVTSVSNLLDMLVKAVEQNRVYLFSNILLSGSLLIAVPTIQYLGLWAVALANLVGLFMSFAVVITYLQRRGYYYHFEWRYGLSVIFASAIAVIIGQGLLWLGASVILATVLTAVSYLVFMWFLLPLKPDEQAIMLEILPARLRQVFS